MSASWGAAFGEGLWNAWDREARDYRDRRQKRKEEERQKRQALKEQMERERYKDANLADSNSIIGEQMNAAISQAAGGGIYNPYNLMNLALEKGGADKPVISTNTVKEQEENEQRAREALKREREDKEWEVKDSNNNLQLFKNQVLRNEMQEALDKKPQLEAEEAEDKKRQRQREDEKFNLEKQKALSAIRANNAQAYNYSSSARLSEAKAKGIADGTYGRTKQQQKLITDADAYNAEMSGLMKQLRNSEGILKSLKDQKSVVLEDGREVKGEQLKKMYAEEQKTYKKLLDQINNRRTAWEDQLSIYNKAYGGQQPSTIPVEGEAEKQSETQSAEAFKARAGKPNNTLPTVENAFKNISDAAQNSVTANNETGYNQNLVNVFAAMTNKQSLEGILTPQLLRWLNAKNPELAKQIVDYQKQRNGIAMAQAAEEEALKATALAQQQRQQQQALQMKGYAL